MAKLYLTDKTKLISQGDSFSEDILLDTAGDDISVAQVALQYTPTDFDVTVDLTGTEFPLTVFNTNDTAKGQIYLVNGITNLSVNKANAKVGTLHIKNKKAITAKQDNFIFVFTDGEGNGFTSNAVSHDTYTFVLHSVVNSEFITKKKSDLDQNGVVDMADLQILLAVWENTAKPPADLNQDGFVNSLDVAIMLGEWG